MLASQPLVHQQVAIDNLSDSDWNVIVDPITDSVVVILHHYYYISVPLATAGDSCNRPLSAPLVAREHLLYSP